MNEKRIHIHVYMDRSKLRIEGIEYKLYNTNLYKLIVFKKNK